MFYFLTSETDASKSISPQKEQRIMYPQIKRGCSNHQGKAAFQNDSFRQQSTILATLVITFYN